MKKRKAQETLTLNLSFFAVGPPYPNNPTEVPLIDMMTVEFVESANYYVMNEKG